MSDKLVSNEIRNKLIKYASSGALGKMKSLANEILENDWDISFNLAFCEAALNNHVNIVQYFFSEEEILQTLDLDSYDKMEFLCSNNAMDVLGIRNNVW